MVEPTEGLATNHRMEEREAVELARKYGLELVDMDHFRIDNDLLRSIPFDTMLRYNFVPEAQRDGRLIIVMVDPVDITKLDELELLLGKPIEAKLGRRSAIEEILKRSEGAQRVLDEASEDFRLQLVQEDADGDEVLSLDSITADGSPIIKLVDSTIFNAIQRRASDIHIETRETEVIIKYRIDGVLYQGYGAHRPAAPSDDHQPRQGDGRVGYRREADSAGWSLQSSVSKVEISTSASPSCLRSTARTQ